MEFGSSPSPKGKENCSTLPLRLPYQPPPSPLYTSCCLSIPLIASHLFFLRPVSDPQFHTFGGSDYVITYWDKCHCIIYFIHGQYSHAQLVSRCPDIQHWTGNNVVYILHVHCIEPCLAHGEEKRYPLVGPFTMHVPLAGKYESFPSSTARLDFLNISPHLFNQNFRILIPAKFHFRPLFNGSITNAGNGLSRDVCICVVAMDD